MTYRTDLIKATDTQLSQAERDGKICDCGTCFACYVREQAQCYDTGQYAFHVPPVSTWQWDRWDWIRFIQQCRHD